MSALHGFHANARTLIVPAGFHRRNAQDGSALANEPHVRVNKPNAGPDIRTESLRDVAHDFIPAIASPLRNPLARPAFRLRRCMTVESQGVKMLRIFQCLATRCLIWGGLVCGVLLPGAVHGEQITHGHLSGTGHMSGTVRAAIGGDDFSFAASASPVGGIWGPANCFAPMCIAGTTIDLDARFSGKDFPGTATYAERIYTHVGSLTGDSWMDARWLGAVTIPQDFAGGTLTSPFLFEGLFGFPGGSLSLSGFGTIYADFVPRPTGTFHLRSITYQFEDSANRSVNPEPSTWLLIATGTAWLARRRRTGR